MRFHTLSCITAMLFFGGLEFSIQETPQEQKVVSRQKKGHRRYRLVDVGTFGGPESFINGPVNGGIAVNLRGTTVGGSATSVSRPPNSISFFCGGLDGSVPFIFHAFEWRDGEVTDLGALPPAINTCSNAQSINDAGEIVGSSENGLVDPVSGGNQFRAVLWKPDCGGGIVPTQGNDAKCGHAFMLVPCDEDEMDSMGCITDDDAERNVVAPRSTASMAQAQITSTEANLTPNEMKDRVRAFLADRHRRFRFRGFPTN